MSLWEGGGGGGKGGGMEHFYKLQQLSTRLSV